MSMCCRGRTDGRVGAVHVGFIHSSVLPSSVSVGMLIVCIAYIHTCAYLDWPGGEGEGDTTVSVGHGNGYSYTTQDGSHTHTHHWARLAPLSTMNGVLWSGTFYLRTCVWCGRGWLPALFRAGWPADRPDCLPTQAAARHICVYTCVYVCVYVCMYVCVSHSVFSAHIHLNL